MRELFKKIYKDIIYYEKDAISMDKEINEEIEKYIEPFNEKLTKSEKEDLKNILYRISLDAEENGFYLGVKYTVKAIINMSFK